MNGKKFWGWLAGLEILAFTVVEGSMFTLGLLVAPALFKKIESRDLAGKVFGAILDRWQWAGLIGTALLVVGGILGLVLVNSRSRLTIARLVVSVAMLGLIVAFSTVLGRMNDALNALPQPLDNYPVDQNPRLDIDAMHKLSNNLLSAAVMLGLVWFGLWLAALIRSRSTQAVPATPAQPEAVYSPADA